MDRTTRNRISELVTLYIYHYIQVSPPIALGKYTDKTIEWFELHINVKIKAKFYLCDEDCPILLAKVYSGGKDITTEMIYHGYAVRVDNASFKDKCE